MRITVTNPQKTLDKLLAIDKELSSKAIEKTTVAAYKNLRFFAKPHYSGKSTLERNIDYKLKSQAGIVWIKDRNMMVDSKYGRINYINFVLHGTKPHEIVPKDRKVLRFKSLSGFVFTKRVRHPGYKGDDFVHKAIKKTFEELDKILKDIK